MVTTDTVKKCALLLDFENLILGLENDVLAGDHTFSISEILRYAEQAYGPVVYRKAFADWGNSKFRAYAVELQRAGVEMQHVVRTGMNNKNAADMFLTIHALDSLRAYPDIEVFILGTGDGDFLPLLARLRAAGRRTVVLGTRGTTAETLLQNCDEFVCYVQGGLFRVPRLNVPLGTFRRAVDDHPDPGAPPERHQDTATGLAGSVIGVPGGQVVEENRQGRRQCDTQDGWAHRRIVSIRGAPCRGPGDRGQAKAQPVDNSVEDAFTSWYAVGDSASRPHDAQSFLEDICRIINWLHQYADAQTGLRRPPPGQAGPVHKKRPVNAPGAPALSRRKRPVAWKPDR